MRVGENPYSGIFYAVCALFTSKVLEYANSFLRHVSKLTRQGTVI